MTLSQALLGLAAPLDSLRQSAFGWALRAPLLPSILTRRDRRIAAIGSAHAVMAFGVALWFPVLLFALGPVLLGVAHVAADIRYLVLRRKLAPFWRNAVWGGCAVLIALRGLDELGLLGFGLTRTEFAVVFAWTALGLVAGAREAGSWTRAAVAAPPLALAGWAALKHPLFGLMAFTHLHNVMALVLWGVLFQRKLRALLLPLGLIGACTAVLVSGALHGVLLNHSDRVAFGLDLFELSGWLAPGFAEHHAVGLTVAYVFLQSVHYAAWLIFIPQSESGTQGTLTFRMSARSLLRDFSGTPLVAIALSFLVVIGGALFDVHEARRLYLSLAMFHVYLEFALLAYFWARSTPQRPLPARSAL